MSVAEHLVAHTRGGDMSLTRGERARWLWEQLRRAFPDAFGSTLVPDHHHLVVPPGGLRRYRGVLSVFTRRFGVRFDVLEPQPCNSAAILARVLRYVALNAVRAGYVDDPWAWPWCTLRCLAGATMPAWASHREVAAATRTSPQAVLSRLTNGADANFERPRRVALMSLSLASAQAAVASSLRVPPRWTLSEPRPRRVLTQLLFAVGAPCASELARALGCTRRTIYNLRKRADPALEAALLCASDPRLLIHGFASDD